MGTSGHSSARDTSARDEVASSCLPNMRLHTATHLLSDKLLVETNGATSRTYFRGGKILLATKTEGLFSLEAPLPLRNGAWQPRQCSTNESVMGCLYGCATFSCCINNPCCNKIFSHCIKLLLENFQANIILLV